MSDASDMSSVIIAKSDQLNSDDLISGPITVTITSVAIRPGTEQPVSVFFDGDGGKPYKCCKSMARVMVHCWGPDANKYVGHSMTLYRDPKVLWGGMAVGGIRISHMSHLDGAVTIALTATKGSKKLFTVQPMAEAGAPKKQTLSEWLTEVGSALADAKTAESVNAIVSGDKVQKALASLKNGALAMLQERIAEATKRTTPTHESGSGDGDTEFLNEGTTSASPSETAGAEDPDPLDAILADIATISLAHATSAAAGTNKLFNEAIARLSEAGQARVRERLTARLAELIGEMAP